jgi:hypothetical protein
VDTAWQAIAAELWAIDTACKQSRQSRGHSNQRRGHSESGPTVCTRVQQRARVRCCSPPPTLFRPTMRATALPAARWRPHAGGRTLAGACVCTAVCCGTAGCRTLAAARLRGRVLAGPCACAAVCLWGRVLWHLRLEDERSQRVELPVDKRLDLGRAVQRHRVGGVPAAHTNATPRSTCTRRSSVVGAGGARGARGARVCCPGRGGRALRVGEEARHHVGDGVDVSGAAVLRQQRVEP